MPGGHLLLLGPDEAVVGRYEPVSCPRVDLRAQAPVVWAALAEAVAVRVDGRPVSADLAGLDSTTLACLAAQRGPVAAVTFADERLRDDDLAFSVRTAATVPGLIDRMVPGAPGTVYYAGLDDLSELPVTDAPNAYAVTASIKRAVLDTVAIPRARGCTSPARPGTLCCPPPPPISRICCASAGTAGRCSTPSPTPAYGTPPPSMCSPASARHRR
ncbi:hypothetical protein [Streptomyces sp. NPDC059631]|uniref:hypothetical protein n=1 Tax=unclassified Streptomyces TaxID=2593676 RepID=UPI0036BEDB14